MDISDYKKMTRAELDQEIERLTKLDAELNILIADSWRQIKFVVLGAMLLGCGLAIYSMVKG